MDFVADQLAEGTKIRLLTISDIYSRESLAIVARHRLRGEDVVTTLNRIITKRAAPKCQFVDNGSGTDCWTCGLTTIPRSISAARQADRQLLIETFNGSLLEECLNVHWFTSLAEVRSVVEEWRIDHNEIRPHMALKDQTPTAFARSAVSGRPEIGY